MNLLFDHLVVKVGHLPGAIKSYTDAGFTVSKGGTHRFGLSENALIFFSDGTFIELLSVKKGIRPLLLRLFAKTRAFRSLKYSRKWGLFHRFYDRALSLPDGVIDFCLLTDELPNELNRIENEGLFVTKPFPASRKRPDGTVVKWDMASTLLTELPFMRSPYRPFFQPSEDMVTHANGVTGIDAICLLALDFKEMVRNLSSVLHQEPQYKSGTEDKEAIFPMGPATLLIKKSSEHDDLVRKYRGKGLGAYAVMWKFDASGSSKQHDFANLSGLVSE